MDLSQNPIFWPTANSTPIGGTDHTLSQGEPALGLQQNTGRVDEAWIHYRDAKFTTSFKTVFEAEGIETVLTPYRSPKANAFAERWVRTVREECLDLLLIISDSHLKRVLSEYISYYNYRRAHQGIGQRMPIPIPIPLAERVPEKSAPTQGAVNRRDVPGGIIHDYYRTHYCDCAETSAA